MSRSQTTAAAGSSVRTGCRQISQGAKHPLHPNYYPDRPNHLLPPPEATPTLAFSIARRCSRASEQFRIPRAFHVSLKACSGYIMCLPRTMLCCFLPGSRHCKGQRFGVHGPILSQARCEQLRSHACHWIPCLLLASLRLSLRFPVLFSVLLFFLLLSDPPCPLPLFLDRLLP